MSTTHRRGSPVHGHYRLSSSVFYHQPGIGLYIVCAKLWTHNVCSDVPCHTAPIAVGRSLHTQKISPREGVVCSIIRDPIRCFATHRTHFVSVYRVCNAINSQRVLRSTVSCSTDHRRSVVCAYSDQEITIGVHGRGHGQASRHLLSHTHTEDI